MHYKHAFCATRSGNDPSPRPHVLPFTFHTQNNPFFPFLPLLLYTMAKKKSMQELVKPLRKLSLLVSTTTSSSTGSKRYCCPPLEFHSPPPPLLPVCIYIFSTQPHSPTTTTTPFSLQHDHEQHDIISWLPREIALAIFSMLSFQDLVRVQLVNKIVHISLNNNNNNTYTLIDMSYMETHCTGCIDMASSLSSITSTLSRPLLA